MIRALLRDAGRVELWSSALAGFLLRGGLALLLLPIVPLPSVVSLATLIGPASLTAGTPSPALAGRVAALVIALVALYIASGLAAAGAEAACIRGVAGAQQPGDRQQPGDARPPRDRRLVTWARILAARTVAAFPLWIALAWGIARIGMSAYAELIGPGDPSVPVVERIVGRVPDALLVVGIAWILSEAAGALGARRVVLGGAGALRAAAGGWAFLLRRPRPALRGLAVALATFAVPTLVLLPLLALGRTRVEDALASGSDVTAFVPAVLLAASWVGSLALIGVAAGLRSAAWTIAARS